LSRYENPRINVNMGVAKGIMIGIIALIVIGVVVGSAVQIVDAGHRGVLLHWNAVDLTVAPFI